MTQDMDGAPAASWHPDPTGRHQLRYWDGYAWTAHVSDDGVISLEPLTPTDIEPEANVLGAAVALLGVLVCNSVVMGILTVWLHNFRYQLLYDLILPAVVGLFVFLDARRIARPEITGPPSLWWACTVVFLGVAVAVYVFQRPRFIWRAAHREAWTKQQLYDPTNPFAEDWSSPNRPA